MGPCAGVSRACDGNRVCEVFVILVTKLGVEPNRCRVERFRSGLRMQ